MPDWTKSMQQTFEYYIVDPNTWKDKTPLRSVLSSKISRDLNAETQGSFSLTVTEPLGECYVRVYLVTNQNGIKERFPMGTYLIQTPAYGFDGKVKNVTLDAYTPLLELKENQPPLGYSILEGENIMDIAYRLIRENGRAPVVSLKDDTKLFFDFVANTDDTWMTFLNDLIANAKFSLGLDELGKVIFNPIQTVNSMQPIWTYDDSNSSILYPEIEVKQDLYGIPNVVEVIFSNNKQYQYVKVVNDDPNSPTSTINRGREITHRVTNPSTLGNPTVEQLKEYGTQVLKELSSLEYTITYKHGYCPVRIGDCVRLNYEKAGLVNIKAKVISQSIDCVPGCPVSETAIYTNQLWG